MNIVVCIKQVPDTTEVRINPETNTLMREGVDSIINPFDMYAIEEGIRMKERAGEGKVTVITMGPPQAEDALREAISLGCDEALLVSDRAFAGSDTWATSYTLAKAIELLGNFDIIICGKQAIDGDTAQVGPGIAAHLDIPQITFVKKCDIDGRKVVCHRMTEEGYDVVEGTLPLLITVVKDINEPRLPSLRGKMKAKKAEIKKVTNEDLKLDLSDIGLDGSPTVVHRVFAPPVREGGEILEGELNEVCDNLASLLKEEL